MEVELCRIRGGDDDSGRFKRREAKTRMYRIPKKDQTRSTGERDADVNVNVQYRYKNAMKGGGVWWIG